MSENSEESIVIRTDESVHVYPTEYFVRFVRKEHVEKIPLDVQRAIVSEWLKYLPAAKTEKESVEAKEITH